MLSVQCEVMEGKAVASGSQIDLDLYGALTDRLGRAFQRLGLKRVLRTINAPSVADYIAHVAREEEDGA